jgi:hypothetical protein
MTLSVGLPSGMPDSVQRINVDIPQCEGMVTYVQTDTRICTIYTVVAMSHFQLRAELVYV